MSNKPYIVNDIVSLSSSQSYNVIDININTSKSSGMHVVMTTMFTIRKKYKKKSFNDSNSLLVVYDLPSGCYIDPYELERRHYWNVLLQSIPTTSSIRIHTYNSSSDNEAIAEYTSNNIIGIELLYIDTSISKKNDYIYYNISFNLPIHLRYHLPSYNETYANINIKYPTIYINDNVNTITNGNKNHNIERIYDRTYQGKIGNAKTMNNNINNYKHVKCLDKLMYKIDGINRQSSSCVGMITLRMPLGSLDHAIIIDIITFFTITITTIAILLSLSRRGSTSFMKGA